MMGIGQLPLSQRKDVFVIVNSSTFELLVFVGFFFLTPLCKNLDALMTNMTEKPMNPFMNAGLSVVLRGYAGNPGC